MVREPSGTKVREGEDFDPDDLQVASGSTAVSPGFNTWTTASTDRPVLLEFELNVSTDGTTDGQVDVDVDESGGTVADYSLTSLAPSGLGARVVETIQVYVPAGGQYQVNNVSDPTANNAINLVRQVTL